MVTYEFTYGNKFTYGKEQSKNVKVSFSGEEYRDCVRQADIHRKVLKSDTGMRHFLISHKEVI